MRFAGRACALGVVLALLVALPLGAPQGCADCPPGCPMHAQRDGATARLGCHRSPPPPTGETCLRSACGHDVLARAEVVVPAVLPGPARVLPVTSARAPRVDAPRLVSRFAPEPPTDPPRAVRG
jgi:hypothetical protein